MSLIAKDNSSKDFELVPEGTYIARCYKLVDLGTQETTYQGQPSGLKGKIRITWELPGALMSDGRPFVIGSLYTNGLSEKSRLRRDLTAWRGKSFTDEELEGFNLHNIVGCYCFLQVIHKKKGDDMKAEIASIMSIPKGTPLPEPVNKLAIFDFDDYDLETFESLTNWEKSEIQKSPEWAALHAPASAVSTPAVQQQGMFNQGYTPELDEEAIPF